MLEIENHQINPKMYSPLVLAYIGDVVYELLVREQIVLRANMPVNQLHCHAVEYVCASAQSKAIELIMDLLSEEEVNIYKRGRNANGNHVPKNASPQEYRRATGLEALIGYLYLQKRMDRIKELFAIIWNKLIPTNQES